MDKPRRPTHTCQFCLKRSDLDGGIFVKGMAATAIICQECVTDCNDAIAMHMRAEKTKQEKTKPGA